MLGSKVRTVPGIDLRLAVMDYAKMAGADLSWDKVLEQGRNGKGSGREERDGGRGGR